jgi:hypothetical protein
VGGCGVNGQLDLFNAPKARGSDPSTSVDAAASLPPCGSLESAILGCFDAGGLTDDELCERVEAYAPTVKTCRSRLAKRGLLVPTSERRPSWRGRDQIVWRLP